MDLNENLRDVRAEIEEVRSLLREETPKLFAFDVTVANVTYNANTNSVSISVEPSSKAREQLSEEFGGVDVRAGGQMEFEYILSESTDD